MQAKVFWAWYLGGIVAFFGLSAFAGEEPVPSALLLNSYHPGFSWSAGETSALQEECEAAGIPLYIEYLDTKNFPKLGHFPALSAYLAQKYRLALIRLVIAVDNSALEFACRYRHDLWPDAAIVFCGINDYQPEMISGQKRITGIAQVMDIRGTLQLALRLDPEMRGLYAIHDNTLTGRALRQEMETVAKEYAGRLSFEYSDGRPWHEIVARAASLPAGWASLFLSYSSAPNGESYEYRDLTQDLAARSPRAVYAIHEEVLGYGIVGGSLLSGRYHGKQAAALALRVWRSEDPDAIAVKVLPAGRIMVDWRQITRLGISLSRLPAGAVIANQPESIWEKHLSLATAAAVVITVLAAATGLLTICLLRRRQVERALRQSEMRFQSLFDNMAEGVALHEMIYGAFGQPSDYRILAVNASFERILKLRAADVIGKTATEAYGTAEPPFLDDYAAVVASKAARRMEVYFEPMKRHFAISVTPWREHGFATIFADVTEQRLSQERLRQSEKMEAIGQLAGGIAHDFNNQLAGIIGYAELLERRMPDDKSREFVSGILTAAQRAVDLVQKLLAFGRKGKYCVSVVDLNCLIAEVAAILERSIDKRISIQRRLTATPALTRGDPTQLQNAILNLALNARDAMSQGGEIIFATEMMVLDAEQSQRLSAELSPGCYVRVTVTDTGCGMSEEVKRHLFEPFFTTKPPGAGTGMGLASVYGTVRSHEGAITVYSEPGHGTTFRIYLPGCETKESAGHGAAVEPAALQRGQGHVLIVDDEEICRKMLAAMLEELGYRVIACGSGRDAIAFYRQGWQNVHLIILDLIMPEMNGCQVFSALREINPQAKVIITSGHSLNGEAQSVLDAGAVAFISKPYQQIDLSRKIAEAMGSSASRGHG